MKFTNIIFFILLGSLTTKLVADYNDCRCCLGGKEVGGIPLPGSGDQQFQCNTVSCTATCLANFRGAYGVCRADTPSCACKYAVNPKLCK